MVEDHATTRSTFSPRIAQWGATLRRSPDLVLLVALSLSLPLLLQEPVGLVRVPAGLFIVLFAPGYALMSAVFPRRDDIDGVIRGALSLGLSIALIPALALLLNWLPGGIDAVSITISIAVWIVAFSCAALRRRALVSEPGEAVAFDRIGPRSRLRPRRDASRWVIIGASALAVAITIPALYATFGSASSGEPTTFYLLGEEGQLEYYPREATINDPVSTTVGIGNGATRQGSFRIEVWIAADINRPAPLLIYSEGPINIAPGKGQEWPITWRMPQAGDDQRIDFLLYVDDDPQPIRRLELVMDVVEPSS